MITPTTCIYTPALPHSACPATRFLALHTHLDKKRRLSLLWAERRLLCCCSAEPRWPRCSRAPPPRLLLLKDLRATTGEGGAEMSRGESQMKSLRSGDAVGRLGSGGSPSVTLPTPPTSKRSIEWQTCLSPLRLRGGGFRGRFDA